MNNKNSIVKKLIIYFLLLNIFAVIVVSSYSYFRAKDALVKRTFDQLTSVRIEKKYRIEKYFQDRILDIDLVSKTQDIKSIIEYLTDFQNTKLYNDKIYSEYNKFLKRHFFSTNYYKRLFVIDKSGLTVYFNASDHDSLELAFDQVQNLPVLGLFQKVDTSQITIIEDYKLDKETNLPAIYLGSPVWDEKHTLMGAAIIELNIDAINSIMYENNPHNGLGKSGESYLVGDDFLMRSTSRFQDNSIFKTEVNTIGVKKALDGETGTDVILDYRDISVLSAYSKVDIQSLNWAILAEIDEKEAMVPIESIRNNILYLSVLMSLLLFAFVYIIARRISLPIVKLKDAAQKITKGNYDVFVEDIVSNDEIGSLIDAFNEMSSKIKEQTENIKLERSMRLSSMIDGQELERQRLSRELHDGLGQSILAIKMRLERMASASPDQANKILEEVQGLFANTINEVRSISNNLMPAILNEFGLVDALKNLFKEVHLNAGINIEFDYTEFNLEVEDKINTYLYRICQEALNNIIKHSEAKLAVVEIKSTEQEIFLTIYDDGKGFNYSDNRKLCGNGISNMKERVHLLNGYIKINSQKGSGTRLHLIIPIKSN